MLRSDVTSADIVLITEMVMTVGAPGTADGAALRRRYVHLVLQALHDPGLETVYFSRSGQDVRRRDPAAPLSSMPLGYPDYSDRGAQTIRSPRPSSPRPSPAPDFLDAPDLIIAATAEQAGLTVLAFDKDFRVDTPDHRAEPIERLAAP